MSGGGGRGQRGANCGSFTIRPQQVKLAGHGPGTGTTPPHACEESSLELNYVSSPNFTPFFLSSCGTVSTDTYLAGKWLLVACKLA